MPQLFLAGLLALFGNMVIYSGLALINGNFLSKTFAGFYEQTETWQRLVIMSLLFAPLANFIFSRVYKLADPATAGMLMLGSLVLVLIAKSLLLGVGAVTPRLVMASVLLTACAVWVAYELHKA